MDNVDSNALFKPHWFGWFGAGIVPGMAPYKGIYYIYALLVNLFVTIGYPTHLSLMLFRNDTLGDDIKNLAVSVTCIACSTKFVIYATQLHKVHKMAAILRALDARVCTPMDRQFFKQTRKSARNIAYLFMGLYLMIGISAELSFVFQTERRLLYPAWFPFDWRTSTRNFYISNVYQIVGISYQLLQNYVDDSLPPVALCLLSVHIKLLGMRVSRIGHTCADQKENEKELKQCIIDQKNLYLLFDTIQDIVSRPMFLQFAVTAFNICVAMAALIFYVDSPFDRLYYFTYFMAMPLQIFPTCYYGSDFQMLLVQLHYDVFSCNWMDQTPKFRKHMILFCERSLKQETAMAGGMVRIHLDTFFSTCKGAYSLFAVIMKMK